MTENFFLPSGDLSESISIFISSFGVLDKVCTIVHKLTNDTTGLVGETLSINTCEWKWFFGDWTFDDEWWSVVDFDVGVFVESIFGPKNFFNFRTVSSDIFQFASGQNLSI